MKKILLMLSATLISVVIFGQRNVDLDREMYSYGVRKLATTPLNIGERNYTVSAKIGVKTADLTSEEEVISKLKINGLERIIDGRANLVKFNFEDVRISSISVEDKSYDTKDKDGKVTGRVYQYQGVVKYTYQCIYSLIDLNGKTLSSVTIDRYSDVKSHLTEMFSKYKDASVYLKNNHQFIQEKLTRDNLESCINSANSQLTSQFGYQPLSYLAKFWFVGDKEHQDYDNQKQISLQIKDLLSRVKADESIESLKPEFAEVIALLEVYKTKYTGKTKHDKKMRYSAFYNIAKLYEIIENFDGCRKEAQAIIDNEYDKGDGKDFLKDCDKEVEILNRNGISSKHFPVNQSIV